MLTYNPPLTEEQCRELFGDSICRTCGRKARYHGLHNATWNRSDPCVWTWHGVVKDEIDRLRKEVEVTENPEG